LIERVWHADEQLAAGGIAQRLRNTEQGFAGAIDRENVALGVERAVG